MRFYVHHEAEPVYTLAVEWPASRAAPVSEVCAQFAAAFNKAGMVLTLCGMFTHLQGKHDDAMALYDRALELHPSLVETLAMRASLFYEKQLLPKAYADFETAVAASPTHPDIFCHRGQLHLLQNEFSQAVSDLRDAVRLDSSSVLAHVHLGMALHRNQQQNEALQAFEKAAALFPKSPDVFNYYGELLLELQKTDEAVEKIGKAIKLGGGKFALAHVNQAVIQMTTGDMQGAMAELQSAVTVDPLCETAHVHMAHLHIQDKALQAAVDSYDKAIELLRVPQELTECFAMREAVAAQLQLLTAQPALYEPVMEEIRQMQAQMQAQMMGQ